MKTTLIMILILFASVANSVVIDFSDEWKITIRQNPSGRVAYAVIAKLPSGLGTLDNDVIEFVWDAATGDVVKYEVFASINGREFWLVGDTDTAPTLTDPYVLPVPLPWGSKVVIQTQAVGNNGVRGKMSPESDPVWRVR